MAWPLSPSTTYVANSTPVIKAADLNLFQSGINSIFNGSSSLKQMLIDAVGAAAVSLTAGIAAQITGGALQLDGASGDTSPELVSVAVPSARKLLWKISNSYSNTYFYAPLADGVSKIAGLEIITNASWNGSQWVRDSASTPVTKLVLNRNSFWIYGYSGASPFADNAWTATTQIQSDGSFYTSTGSISATAAAATINGPHFVGNSATPTKAVGAAAGSGAGIGLIGNDAGGLVTLTTGTAALTTGILFTVTFASAYGASPNVVFSPANANAANEISKVYVGESTTGFTLSAQAALTNTSQVYSYNYNVIG